MKIEELVDIIQMPLLRLIKYCKYKWIKIIGFIFTILFIPLGTLITVPLILYVIVADTYKEI